MTEARRIARYEDLLDLPEHVVGEIVKGELVVSPRLAGPHSHAESGVNSALFTPFSKRPGGGDGPGGWWILVEPELHLGEDVLVPDVAGWRRERLPQGPADAAFTVAPDWVCEVVSPRTARHDRIVKMELYGGYGVGHVWIVDPLLRTLEVYRRQEAIWARVQVSADYVGIRAEPFEAVEIDMGRWWLEPPEEPAPSGPGAG